MTKITVIHQPDFMPYPGFFHRFLNADEWVVFDDVQYVDRGWHNRDKIKVNGVAKWLTVQVEKKPVDTPINKMKVAKTDWKTLHLNTIKTNYGKAPYFKEIMPYINELYSFDCEMMIDFNMKSIDMLCDLFDIKINRIFSSTLNKEGKSNELLISTLKCVNSKRYLSGTGALAYMKPELFEENGIEVIYQNYTQPVYPQINGDFVAGLSSIDMFFNCGIEESRKILRNC